MRPIKFRAWDKVNRRMLIVERLYYPFWIYGYVPNGECDIFCREFELMQFTGLLDASGVNEIYENDIIDMNGNLIGNIYENENLLEEKTNIVIEGMGTKTWQDTQQQINKRGCEYAK